MLESSKVTNVLLAVIAVCLIAIAFRPTLITPVSAQAARAIDGESDNDRFAAISTVNKTAALQADATRAIATSIDGLAKSTADIAKALDSLSRAVMDMGGRMAEGQAATVGTLPATPE